MISEHIREAIDYLLTIAHWEADVRLYNNSQFPHDRIVDAIKQTEEWLETLPDAPAPDWSQAPEWAGWWTRNADGSVYWHENEPKLFQRSSWVSMLGHIENAGEEHRPIKVKRP